MTRELLKSEIDKVPDQHLEVLYRIIKALEERASGFRERDAQSWRTFVDETYGSMVDSPIGRGPQGAFEIREPIR